MLLLFSLKLRNGFGEDNFFFGGGDFFLSCFCGSLGFYLLNDAVFESILCFQELF